MLVDNNSIQQNVMSSMRLLAPWLNGERIRNWQYTSFPEMRSDDACSTDFLITSLARSGPRRMCRMSPRKFAQSQREAVANFLMVIII